MSRILALALMLNCTLVSANSGGSTYNLPPLINAILSDDYDAAKAIVSPRNYQSAYFGGTPELFFAITPTCRPRFLTLLLENGANPNSREVGTESTPILRALAGGDLECIDLLIDNGADVMLTDVNGSGSAFKAVSSEKIDVLFRVASMGVDIDKPAKDGTTPLMYAALAGHAEIIQFLLKNGADECQRNSRDMTAKVYAEISNNSETANLFLKNCGLY